MKRLFAILSMLIIIAACSKNPVSPAINHEAPQLSGTAPESASGGRIEIGSNLLRMFNQQGGESVIWYADDGSGHSRVALIDKNEKLELYPGGLVSWHGANFGVLQNSATNYPELVLYIDGKIRCKMDAENGSADVSNEYRVAGKRVIGPRLAAIADATSPEDMVIKFNLLLGAMRAHGLIERENALTMH